MMLLVIKISHHMKRSYIYLPLLLVLISCGGKNKKVQDSDSSVTHEVAPATSYVTPEESVPDSTVSEFMSDDLKRFYLRGPVKAVNPKDYAAFVSALTSQLKFDNVGKLTSTLSDLVDNEMKINDDGVIAYTSTRESDGTTFELEFTKWDENLNPIAGKYKSDGPQEIWEVLFTIRYNKFDSKGNWLSRTFKGESSTSQMDAEGNYMSPEKEPYELTETRTINYW